MNEGGPSPPATAPLVPDYARPVAGARLNNLPYLTVAVWCGALPLAVGTVVFALWLATGDRDLHAVGLLTILGGLLLFLVGTICLVADAAKSAPGGRWKRAAVALLLLANFPAAFTFIAAAAHIEFSVTITVQNTGSATIDSFVVTVPGVTKEMGPIPPGASRRVRIHPTADGAADYTMKESGVTSTGPLIGYVSAGMGGRCTVGVNGQSGSVK